MKQVGKVHEKEQDAAVTGSAASESGKGSVPRPPDHRCPEIGANTLQGAFVSGAKWWEYASTGGTMWASDRDKAWTEAERRYPGANGTARIATPSATSPNPNVQAPPGRTYTVGIEGALPKIADGTETS